MCRECDRFFLDSLEFKLFLNLFPVHTLHTGVTGRQKVTCIAPGRARQPAPRLPPAPTRGTARVGQRRPALARLARAATACSVGSGGPPAPPIRSIDALRGRTRGCHVSMPPVAAARRRAAAGFPGWLLFAAQRARSSVPSSRVRSAVPHARGVAPVPERRHIAARRLPSADNAREPCRRPKAVDHDHRARRRAGPGVASRGAELGSCSSFVCGACCSAARLCVFEVHALRKCVTASAPSAAGRGRVCPGRFAGWGRREEGWKEEKDGGS